MEKGSGLKLGLGSGLNSGGVQVEKKEVSSLSSFTRNCGSSKRGFVIGVKKIIKCNILLILYRRVWKVL